MIDEFVLVPLEQIVWKSPIRDFTETDIKNMATSLRVHGQIEPIICKPQDENEVFEGVCGRYRYEGAKQAKLREILVRVYKFENDDEVLDWQLAENLHRKDLTALQKGEAYKRLYDKRVERSGGKVKGEAIVQGIAETQEKLSGEKPSEQIIYDYMRVAKELPDEVKKKITVDRNFGLEHGKQLLRLKDSPEKQLEIVEQFVRKPKSFRQLSKEITKILAPNPPPLPEGKFNVVYADPPWKYDVEYLRGNPETKEYPALTLQEICDKSKELNECLTEDAVLFLWTTNPMLEDALVVMKAWGFAYKTNMVWVKDRMGVGFYFRGQHELLLVGVKGHVHAPEPSNRFASVLQSPRREHSQKPEEVYETIEEMYPDMKYIELFARQKREGWEAWGNEI